MKTQASACWADAVERERESSLQISWPSKDISVLKETNLSWMPCRISEKLLQPERCRSSEDIATQVASRRIQLFKLGFGQIKLFCRRHVKQVRKKNISSELLSTKTIITIESMARVSYSVQMWLPFEWLSGRIYSHFCDRQPIVNKEKERRK